MMLLMEELDMCGIVGQLNKNKKIDPNNFISMRDSLIHRGPDDAGDFFDLGNKLALGHRRLSIIDLSRRGRQPMSNENNTIWIILNGEIYNYKEIKKLLVKHTFKSNTDTEVILHAYEEWGLEGTLKKLRGMFALCIYDQNIGKLFCIRDRIGIKPLVYYLDDNIFIFASEMKAIKKSNRVKLEINPEAIYDFFIYRYVANPKTIYKNTWKLEPGHYLEIDIENFSVKKKKYWTIELNRNLKMDEKMPLKKIESLIENSVRYRMIADTDVSTFLSGGIDSSLITTIAKRYNDKLKAFSIDLQPSEYSEVDYARSLSQHIQVKFQANKVGKNEFNENFNKVIEAYDEPLGDSSIFPTYLLCMYTSKHTKVALSGDGGDEVFYGYEWYNQFNESKKGEIKTLFLNLISQCLHKKANIQNSLERYRRIMYDRFTAEEVQKIFNLKGNGKKSDYMFYEKLGKDNFNESELNYLDFKTFLVDDILYKVDIASMANSLEVRVPFLDHKLVEFMFNLDFELLYKNKELKYLLKKLAIDFIPERNVYRTKKGFSAPVMKWLKVDLHNEIVNGQMVKDDFANKRELIEFLSKEKNLGKIWQLFIFEKWYSTHYKS